MGVLQAIGFEPHCEGGVIGVGDVARLRSLVYANGVMDEADVAALFAINQTCGASSAAWSAFFIDAICDYIIGDVEPVGYLTRANSVWLLERIAPTGKVDQPSGVELTLAVLEKARWAPLELVEVVLDEVASAVASGRGALRSGGDVAGEITPEDIDIVRRALVAYSGEGLVPVTLAEVAKLLEIERAIARPALGRDSSLALMQWADLFSKAIIHAVLGGEGRAVPTRGVALAAAAALERSSAAERPEGVAEVVRSAFGDVGSLYRVQTREDLAIARLERQRIEIITSGALTLADPGDVLSRLDQVSQFSSVAGLVRAGLVRQLGARRESGGGTGSASSGVV